MPCWKEHTPDRREVAVFPHHLKESLKAYLHYELHVKTAAWIKCVPEVAASVVHIDVDRNWLDVEEA